jgi:hypothetical protein
MSGSGPQPHPNFAALFCEAAIRDGGGEVAGAGEDWTDALIAYDESAEHAFQACLIDRSSISPFRINNLQIRLKDDCGDCDTSPNMPRSLTGFSSIAVPLLPR